MDYTARSVRSLSDAGHDIINIDDDDDDIPAVCSALDDFIIEDEDDNLSLRSASPELRPIEPTWRRNTAPRWPETYIDHCTLLSERAKNLGPTASTVRIGDTVEIHTQQPAGLVEDGDFMRVMKIIQNVYSGAIKLRGLICRRNKFFAPMLDPKLNEVSIVTTIDTDDPRPYHIQGLEEISLDEAFRKRRLKVTNAPFPKLSYRDHSPFASRGPDGKKIKKIVEDNDVLVCRYFFAKVYGKGERNSARRIPYQGILQHITPMEADDGGKILTGRSAEHVDLTDNADDGDIILMEPTRSLPHGPNRERQYTFGDAFQGGGGASCAAKLAGLKVVWGFDHDKAAVDTAALNFPRARIFQCEAADFPAAAARFNARCDIVHISLPCQPFSNANTNPNAIKDEINTTCVFAVTGIIRTARPRIITLEEADGLLTREKHKYWFGKLLALIREEGYSVKWAIHNTLEYDISQPRKRLVLIAAAPGIPLPNMPKSTRGRPGSNLPAYLTAREAIGNIPRSATHHNPHLASRTDGVPWDPDRPFKSTILTKNSLCHWDGRRKLTLRELAGIQGFPHTYEFTGTKTVIEKQIGNAVPPPWFKLVFEECIKVLRKVDRIQGRGGRADPRSEGNDDEVNMFRAASRTLSPAPPISSQASGSSIENAIFIDSDGKNIIEID
ncbi:C-5 cytosine methyltransferase [Lasiodiplodia theobromae]|uniref:C-5 cytosine methyltransferase n=1 Tax=Lasiodiplodia theobromae TaxID=45133 RepID=UPI0015C316F8|nr:C-5 cytosine methyltransferase [Lasiodiplodia theobromae]KAF4537478.1 C-5 cytosine methyltransferase [Lasiodiplodia theobromae]